VFVGHPGQHDTGGIASRRVETAAAVRWSMDHIRVNWRDSVLYSEWSWHQLAPYIGKMKSSMAKGLVEQFTTPTDTVYDPFSGAGTVALEAWAGGRHVIAGDLNPYAYVLSAGKLYPPKSVSEAIRQLDVCWSEAASAFRAVDLRRIPAWVRRFFHPETLREVLAVRDVLMRHRQWFLLSCLLGILHHWRPAFLSYPASHTVPYLMVKKYPRNKYPQQYAYREVYPRLAAKVRRAFLRSPEVNRGLSRRIKLSDAAIPSKAVNGSRVSAVITSPPYMNSLSYARDNRLRLWFLGVADARSLEPTISPRKVPFLAMMRSLLPQWSELLPKDGPCVLVLGAVKREGKYHDLPAEIVQIARGLRCGLHVTAVCRNVIPARRRTRGNCCSTREETILVFRKGKQING